mmetsp:Transcript_37966/g.95143  ORF Transcript_37966/g.95143 Transcript_37966/m.95143 type:complete len:182 (-) Transcript_37966:1248-1793(-)
MAFVTSTFSPAYYISEKTNNFFYSGAKPNLINKESFFGKKLSFNFYKNLNRKIFQKKKVNITRKWVAVFGPGGGFFGVGTSEILVIGAVAWLVLGPKRLYQLARDIGKISGEIKNVADEARQTFQQAIDIESLDPSAQLSKNSLDSEIGNSGNKNSKKKKAMKNLDDLAKTEISLSEKKNE